MVKVSEEMGRRGASSSRVCGPKEETSVGRFFSCSFGLKEIDNIK